MMLLKKSLIFSFPLMLLSIPSISYSSVTIFSAEQNCKVRTIDGLFNRCQAVETELQLSTISKSVPEYAKYVSFNSKIDLSINCGLQSPKVSLQGNVIHSGGSSVAEVKTITIPRPSNVSTFKIRVEPGSLSDVVRPGCSISLENEVSLPILEPIEEAVTNIGEDFDLVDIALSAIDIAASNPASKAAISLARKTLESSLDAIQKQIESLDNLLTSTIDDALKQDIEVQIDNLRITRDELSSVIKNVSSCESDPSCAVDFGPAKTSLTARKDASIKTINGVKSFLESEDTRLTGVEEALRARIRAILERPEFKKVVAQ